MAKPWKTMAAAGIMSAVGLFIAPGCAELGPGGGLAMWEEVARLITFPPSTVSRTQSGTTSMTATSITETIESVDTSRSFVQCYFSTTSSDASNAPTCELTSSTQVTIQSGQTNSNLLVSWSVVEFSSGASVQRGTATMAAGSLTDNITIPAAVAVERSFVVVHARTTSTANNIDEQRTLTGRILDSSTIEIARNESGLALDVVWQVVALTGGFVQSGVATIANGQTGTTAAITTVDLTKTFLLGTIRAGANVNGLEEDYLTRIALTDATTISFNRAGSANTVDIAWSAITMGDGATVRSGSVSTTVHTVTVLNSTLSPVVVPSRSTPFVSAMTIGGGTADQDSGTFTPSITSESNISFTRGSIQDRAATVDWFIIEFLAP